MKLWTANAVTALLVAVAAIAQPILASSPRCGRSCDPHGYVVIFSALPALVTVLLALAALGSLVARRRGGLWVVLVATAGCTFEWLLLHSLLAIGHNLVIAAVLVATVVLAIVGLRRSRRTRQLDLKSS